MEDQKARLKQLILDAEALMQTAKAEARQIVGSAEIQAKELVDAARQLHSAAEAEAAELRAEADRVRRQAEADARNLAEDAQARHQAAIEEARTVVASAPEAQGEDPPAVPVDGEEPTQPIPDDVLREASERADQMLRVARSEAKARADEMLETARRRAAQIDEDARRREEVAAKQFRLIKRSMQDEQLELKSRIAELRAELRAVEAELSHHAPPGERAREPRVEVDPAPHPIEAPPAAPESAGRAAEEPERPAPIDEPDRVSLADKLAALEAAERAGDGSPDDYAQAMKRFRRRA